MYKQPSEATQRIATAVIVQGQILPIQPPASNSSWSLAFGGPELVCSDVQGEEALSIQKDLIVTTSYTWDIFNTTRTTCEIPPVYMFWWGPIQLPRNPNPYAQLVTGIGWNNCSVAINPPTSKSYYQSACNATDDQIRAWNMSIIRCELRNTTYSVNFNHHNGQQNISIQTTPEPNAYMVERLIGLAGPHLDSNENFENLLPGCVDPFATNNSIDCYVDASQLPLLSYAAILDAFSSPFIGNITLMPSGDLQIDRTFPRPILRGPKN